MKRSSKKGNEFVVKNLHKKGIKKKHVANKQKATEVNYRDIKDWYYGDKYKPQGMTEGDSQGGVDEDDLQGMIQDESQGNFQFLFNKSDLFRNPGTSSKLVLKKTSRKNIRLGYKKILKKDSLYDELYKDELYKDEDKEDDKEFPCCKEFKKYVGNVHKDKLLYLCEVACKEFNNLFPGRNKKDFGCKIKTSCPFKSCKDTFCSKCYLCLTNFGTENLFKKS